MVKAAQRVVVLADSSKLGREHLVRFAAVDDVDVLVTDDEADPDVVSRSNRTGSRSSPHEHRDPDRQPQPGRTLSCCPGPLERGSVARLAPSSTEPGGKGVNVSRGGRRRRRRRRLRAARGRRRPDRARPAAAGLRLATVPIGQPVRTNYTLTEPTAPPPSSTSPAPPSTRPPARRWPRRSPSTPRAHAGWRCAARCPGHPAGLVRRPGPGRAAHRRAHRRGHLRGPLLACSPPAPTPPPDLLKPTPRSWPSWPAPPRPRSSPTRRRARRRRRPARARRPRGAAHPGRRRRPPLDRGRRAVLRPPAGHHRAQHGGRRRLQPGRLPAGRPRRGVRRRPAAVRRRLRRGLGIVARLRRPHPGPGGRSRRPGHPRFAGSAPSLSH